MEVRRHQLGEAGFIDVSQRWIELKVNEVPLTLGGNELPWFPHTSNSLVTGKLMRTTTKPSTAKCNLAIYTLFLLCEPKYVSCVRLAQILEDLSHDTSTFA